MTKTTYYISQMDCPEEIKLIQGSLKSVRGVQQLEFNLIQQELTITHELSDLSQVESLLISLGMKPQIKSDQETTQPKQLQDVVSRWDWLIIIISGIFAITAEVISFISHSEQSFPVIALSIISMIVGGRQTFLKGLRAIRHFNLNMNFLMSIAIIGAIAIGEWPEAAMVTFLFALAELIEVYSLDKARRAVRSLMEIAPDMATVQSEGSWQTKPVAEINVNSIIWVRPGERIPLDGVITKGQSTVNQAPITGESMPVSKKTGDAIFAGTLNERGSFEFKVTANPGDTLLAKIVRIVQKAQSERAPTQRFVDQFAKYYTPAMVIVAILIATLPPLVLSTAFLPWFYKALVLLVIACPCALVISTPVTVVSGLTAAARHGILIKGGVYLETGHKLKAIAFDKTGTLTYGKPVVTDVKPLSNLSEKEVLQIAASLDAHSEHPIAAAIVTRWKKENPEDTLLQVDNFEAVPGRGVVGEIDKQSYFLGNHHFAEEKNACNEKIETILKLLEQEAKTTIVLGTDHRSIAILAVADTLRESALSAISSLHSLGLRTAMITGDNPTTAQAIAEKLGIDDVKANLLPEDKLNAIETFITKYKAVGMVGDGINDAPALAKASMGFAMGHAGTDVALETADITIMEDNLNKLPFFINLSRRTWHKLAVNIGLSIGIKAIFFILALFGLATLWMAIFADMGASLIVVLNGLSLLRFSETKIS